VFYFSFISPRANVWNKTAV